MLILADADLELLPATHFNDHTLVGSYREFPRSHGNCFSLQTAKGSYRVVNFYYENLKELLGRGMVDWPVQVAILPQNVLVLHDARIPDGWYANRWCEVCCPKYTLPPPQRLTHLRQIIRGERAEQANGWTRILIPTKEGK